MLKNLQLIVKINKMQQTIHLKTCPVPVFNGKNLKFRRSRIFSSLKHLHVTGLASNFRDIIAYKA